LAHQCPTATAQFASKHTNTWASPLEGIRRLFERSRPTSIPNVIEVRSVPQHAFSSASIARAARAGWAVAALPPV